MSSLPVYHHYNLLSSSLEDLELLLRPDLNLRVPVVINLKSLDVDQQRETIGLVENYFVSHNFSFKFPYPIYLITDHEPSISRMTLISGMEELPKFYSQKETKMNVKESHLAARNKLLQQEVRNSDAESNNQEIKIYGNIHKQIHEMEIEREFYQKILNRLLKAKPHG